MGFRNSQRYYFLKENYIRKKHLYKIPIFATILAVFSTLAIFLATHVPRTDTIDGITGSSTPTIIEPITAELPPNITRTINGDTVIYENIELADAETITATGQLSILIAEDIVSADIVEPSVTTTYAILTDAGEPILIDLSFITEALIGESEISANLVVTDTDAPAEVARAEILAPASPTPEQKPHRYFVAIVSPMGAPNSITTTQATALANRAGIYWTGETNGFISSYSIASLTAVSLTTSSCGTNEFTMMDEVANKAFGYANYNSLLANSSTTYANHLIAILPSYCYNKTYSGRYTGIGMLGSNLHGSGFVTVVNYDANASVLGSNASYDTMTLIHELGHNASLHHAGNVQELNLNTWEEYSDLYSIMGYSAPYAPPALDGFFKDALGITSSSETITIPPSASSDTRTIYATNPTSNPKFIKLTESGREYFLEYRAGTGTEQTTYYNIFSRYNTFCIGAGVRVTTAYSTDNRLATLSLPYANNCWKNSLAAGDNFTIGTTTVKITGTTPTSANISISKPAVHPQPIPNGTYLLTNKLNANFAISGGTSAASTKLLLANTTGSDTQKWALTYDGATGFYSILGKNGNSLDISSLNNGTKVQVWGSNNTCGQRWKITKDADGYFEIASACNTSVALEIDAQPNNGVAVQMWQKNNSNAQRWKASDSNDLPPQPTQPIPNGTYFITHKLSSSFAMSGGSGASGTKLTLGSLAGSDTQRWTLAYDSNFGAYSIVGVNGNALDIGSLANGTRVQVYKSNGTCGQRWVVTKDTDGHIELASACSTNAIIEITASPSNGVELQMWQKNNTNGQRWKITGL